MYTRSLSLLLALMISAGWIYLNIFALIGNTLITHQDVRYQEKIQKLLAPETSAKSAGHSLANAFLDYHILRQNKLRITEEMIAAENARLAQDENFPLEEIQNIFQDDSAAFRKVFLATSLAKRLIHEFYAEERAKANNQSFEEWREAQAKKVRILPKSAVE